MTGGHLWEECLCGRPSLINFGGKSRAADLIWPRFGTVINYVEPFAGSLAVLLACPEIQRPRVETVNDANAFLANFWRATAWDPEAVARWADWPVNETDLLSRHKWLLRMVGLLRARLDRDPSYFDARIAGWWVWGASAWIGSGWCEEGSTPTRKLPDVGARSEGGGAGRGVLSSTTRTRLYDIFAALSARLRHVRVACGDFERILTDAVTHRHGLTAVFLDPPYEGFEGMYGQGEPCSARARAWALEAGKRPDMRVCLAGYEGEHDMPSTWECVAWKAKGGYSNAAKGGNNGNANRERLWFSPACLRPGVDTGQLDWTRGL